MSRWTYTSLSFKDFEGQQADVSGFLAAKAVTEGAVAPGAAYTVRLYWWHSSGASVLADDHSDDPVSVTLAGSGTESVTESVSLQWGKGATQYMDTTGRKDYEFPALVNDPMERRDVTYTANYRDYALSSVTVGNHDVTFYYADKSATVTVSFTVEESGTGVETPPAFLAAKAVTEGAVAPGSPYTVRLYWWHPTDAAILSDGFTGDGVSVAAGGSGTESITETVALQWGQGSTQYADTAGNQSVSVPALADDPMEIQSVTYSAQYKDFTLSHASPGSYSRCFYYADKSATVTVSFTVEESGTGGEPEPPPAFLSAEVVAGPEWIDDTIHFRATVRLWRYHHDPPVIQHYAPTLEAIAVDSTGTASTTESVALRWGVGNTSKPDVAGETEVTGDTSVPYNAVSVTYSTAYTDYTIRMETPGDYRIVFWYADGSAEADITVTAEADPGAASGSAALAMVPITTPPVEPYPADGDADMMDFRLYWWHPSASPTWLVASDDAGFGSTWLMSGTESITETLKLQWGRASYTYTDQDGVKEYFNEAYEAVPFASVSVTYTAKWRELRCWSVNEGTPQVMVHFGDKTATVTASFQVQAPPDPEPDPEPRTVSIVAYNYYTDAVVPGAAIYIDGNYMGVTNSSGQWTGTIYQGSHTLKITATGYQSTDVDALANDSFTVE